MKTDIREKIKSGRLFFDGGFGTMLQAKGLKNGEPPELWNLSHPQEVTQVHKSYLDAGSDIITTNTFGVNPNKYQNYRELIAAAVGCAKAAVGDRDKYIAFDVGPTGRLMKPLGDLGFEDAVALFSAGIKEAAKLGVDLIIIETMNDCLETKAAVIAAKESSSLPVFVTNAYDLSGKLMTGAEPEAMIAMLEGLGVDALGMNCSFGPDVMLGIIDKFKSRSSTPLIANPNAGLPCIRNGKTEYDISSDEFASYMRRLAEKGVTILGGCCGTTPEYIKKTVEAVKRVPFELPEKKRLTVVSSGIRAVMVGGEPVLIGERINPTGKPRLKEALRTGNMSYILGEAVSQTEAGAHILDINVGLPDIDEPKMLKSVTEAVQSVTELPLQLDSASPEALEAAMRIYAGKPLINSVDAEKEKMSAVFPLIKKYGGAVIALTMDERGIPSTAEGRAELAQKIIAAASEYGISEQDIIFDPLALAVSSDQSSALTTLRAVELISKLGLKTSLGVSNISFGLPKREKINTSFFTSALEKGLSCAIMNPKSEAMMDAYYSYRALHGMDAACMDYISHASDEVASETAAPEIVTLQRAIVKGLKSKAGELAHELLKSIPPLEVVNLHIIPALNEIGEQFEQHKAYLPQLLMSADAATAAFAQVKAAIPAGQEEKGKAVILATVKGDIHEIGKNIVRVMLESYGFKVYDLGKDVDPQAVLDCVKSTSCKLVGLSALMTTTVPSMERTIKLLHSYDSSIKIVAGGAVLTQEYADMIHADFYAKDAMDTVRYAQEYYSK